MTKIMLVEDDNNLREIYQARLAAEGYEIVSAMDGEAALAIASKELPDLVISDVMMPKISGFEMLDILRNTEALKNVKIIMLTALGQTEDSTRASNLGADRYLVKSQVTLEDIVKATHDLLDGPSAAPAPATIDAPGSAASGPQALPPAGNASDDNTDDDLPAAMTLPTPPAASALPAAPSIPAPTPPADTTVAVPEPATQADTPMLHVVEPPAETPDDDAVPPALAIPPTDTPAPAVVNPHEAPMPPSLPSYEAEVAQAAPVPAAQEEASINNQIQDFISHTDDSVETAPTPADPPPVAPAAPAETATPAEQPAPPIEPPVSSAPAPADSLAPERSSAPITVASPQEDLPDFEPAPEVLDSHQPPKITEDGPAAAVSAPTPSYDRPTSESQPAADEAMTSAISGLTPGGESEDAPSGQPNAEAPGNRSIPVTHISEEPADNFDDDEAPKKKVIKPIHDLKDRPDINKLLALEESKVAAQQAAQTTDSGAGAAPAQNSQSTTGAPAGQTPGQQPFNAPSVDPNSISL